MRQFSIAKLLLSLLIIVCLTVAGWSGYVLFTHKTTPVWGSVILLVDIGVLIWNVQVLRSHHYRPRKPSFKLVFFSLLGIFLVCAFAGVQPLSAYKDNVVNMVGEGIGKLTTPTKPEDNSTQILPGETKVFENWFISLDGGNWKGSTLTVKLTITNLGPRRNFGAPFLESGPELAVIDSTGKRIEAEGDAYKLFYVREFYPGESCSGTLKFQMSPYSGETSLYLYRSLVYSSQKHFLFNLGSPRK